MRNIALFAISSVVYLHVIESFVNGVSTFKISACQAFFETHNFLFATLIVFCFTLLSGRKFSKYFYLFFITLCIYLAFEQYLVALDKFILILNFLFVILSYYFYLFMNSDLAEASNNPIAVWGDLYTGLTLDQEIKIKKNGEEFVARFINWDESTCFLKVDGTIDKIRDDVEVEWSFEGIKFNCSGYVVSGLKEIGVGVRLVDRDSAEDGIFGWGDFYDIIHSRGYSPNLTA